VQNLQDRLSVPPRARILRTWTRAQERYTSSIFDDRREVRRFARIRDERTLRALTPDDIELNVRVAGLEPVRTSRSGGVLTTIARRA